VDGLSLVARNFLFASLIGLALLNSVFGLADITLLPIYADVHFQAGSASRRCGSPCASSASSASPTASTRRRRHAAARKVPTRSAVA